VLVRTIALFLAIPLSLIVAIGAIEYLELPSDWGRQLVIVISLLSLILIVILIGISIQPTIIAQVVKSFTAGLGKIKRLKSFSIRLQSTLLEGIEEYSQNFRFIIINKKRASLALLLILLNNLFVWISAFCLILAIEKTSVPFILVVVVVVLSGFLDMIPLGIPNAEGLKEITITSLLIRGGISESSAAASAVLLSLTRFYLLAAFGIGFLFSMGILYNPNKRLELNKEN
jgi:hypothetical protein